ncbi:hypothetical protein ADK58_13240, partial [Streptomyces sp. XY152]
GARRGIPHEVYVPFLVTGVFVFTFTQSSVLAGGRGISGNLGLGAALPVPGAPLPGLFAVLPLLQRERDRERGTREVERPPQPQVPRDRPHPRQHRALGEGEHEHAR